MMCKFQQIITIRYNSRTVLSVQKEEFSVQKRARNLLRFRYLQFDVACYQVFVGAFGVPLRVWQIS